MVHLREVFPTGRFGAPAGEGEIAAVEAQLEVRVPEPLRRLYRQCDGFREDRGNAKYLLSLTEEDTIGSLLTQTRFYWREWPVHQPTLDLRPFLLFGFSSGDEIWGIDWRTGERIIAYHPQMGAVYETVGSDILAVYQADYALYNEHHRSEDLPTPRHSTRYRKPSS